MIKPGDIVRYVDGNVQRFGDSKFLVVGWSESGQTLMCRLAPGERPVNHLSRCDIFRWFPWRLRKVGRAGGSVFDVKR